jgi:EAL domain
VKTSIGHAQGSQRRDETARSACALLLLTEAVDLANPAAFARIRRVNLTLLSVLSAPIPIAGTEDRPLLRRRIARRSFRQWRRRGARAIRALAGSLNLEVIAEGVETTIQRDALMQLDCEIGQGHLFDEPQPAMQLSCAH